MLPLFLIRIYILERICCHSSEKTKKFVSTDDPEKDEVVGLSAHACACHKDQSYIPSIQYSLTTIHLIVLIFFNDDR